MILEAYLDALGRPLVQGGRYDNLLARFGRPAAATGFVLNLDLVGDALRRRVEAPTLTRLDAVVAWSQAGLDGALRLGATLRLFGLRAIVATESQSLSAARAWGRAAGAQGRAPRGGRRRRPLGRSAGGGAARPGARRGR